MEFTLDRDVPITAWIAIAFFWSICGLALAKGERDERLVASTLAAATLITPFLKAQDSSALQWGVLVLDLMVFAVLLVVALRTLKWWPLFAASFQLLGVLTHAARGADSSLGAWAYITGSVIWSYGMLLAVLTGTIGVWRRRVLDRQSPSRHR